LKEKNINKKWWKKAVFYQIYMSTYADGNCNGYSKFVGMIQKLDYLQGIEVKGI
jgi:trehalose-6-phosphate hydrolase